MSWALAYALTKAALDAMEGRRDDALAAVDQALERREHVAGYEAMLRFEALEVVGDFGGEKKLRELLHIADELHAGQQGAFLRAQKARFRARLPEHDAEAELRESERLFTDSETPFYAAVVQLELAEHMLARGRAEEARPLLEEARGTFEELRAQPWLERVDGTAVTTKVLA